MHQEEEGMLHEPAQWHLGLSAQQLQSIRLVVSYATATCCNTIQMSLHSLFYLLVLLATLSYLIII
jgi:hypothetical protein